MGTSQEVKSQSFQIVCFPVFNSLLRIQSGNVVELMDEDFQTISRKPTSGTRFAERAKPSFAVSVKSTRQVPTVAYGREVVFG